MKSLPKSVIEYYDNFANAKQIIDNFANIEETDDSVSVIMSGKNLIHYFIKFRKNQDKKKATKTDIIEIPIINGTIPVQLMEFYDVEKFLDTIQDLVMIIQDAVPHARDKDGFEILFHKRGVCNDGGSRDIAKVTCNCIRNPKLWKVRFPISKDSDWNISVRQCCTEYEISDSVAAIFVIAGDKVSVRRDSYKGYGYVPGNALDMILDLKCYFKEIGYDLSSNEVNDLYTSLNSTTIRVNPEIPYDQDPFEL